MIVSNQFGRLQSKNEYKGVKFQLPFHQSLPLDCREAALSACLGMEGCCAVEREVDRVLTKFNTTQQVGVVEEKDFFMLLKQNIWQNILRIILIIFNQFAEYWEQHWRPDPTTRKAAERNLGIRGRWEHYFTFAGSPHPLTKPLLIAKPIKREIAHFDFPGGFGEAGSQQSEWLCH